MTDAPPRVAAQRWLSGVPGVAVAVMATAATLLPGLAVAQDAYLRAGLDLWVMSLPLLKFGGGSDEILRDVHH